MAERRIHHLPKAESESEKKRLRVRGLFPAGSPEHSSSVHLTWESSDRGAVRGAALLFDPRLSHPTGVSTRQRIVQALQRAYGNQYFQRLVSGVQADAAARGAEQGIASARAIEEERTVRADVEVPVERVQIEKEQTERPPIGGALAEVYWGRPSERPSPWAAAAAAPRAEASPWAARAIANPAPAWGRDRDAAASDKGMEAAPRAIANPTVNTLKFLETTYGQNTFGVAPWPANFTAPRYVVVPVPHQTPEMIAKKVPPQWYGVPALVSKAYAGDSQPYYLGPGSHLSTFKQSGVDVYYHVSNAMSQRDHDAELEHAKDFRRAFAISLREAERVILKHVEGKKFGPKASMAEVEQIVKDTIRSKLIHPQLGADQTMWGAQYEALQKKSLIRDQKGWHTFGLSNRKEVKDKKGALTKITYDVTKGTTKINVVSSKEIIKY